MSAELPKPVLVIAVAVALFIVLAAVRSFVVPAERANTSVQQRYDELAQSLEEVNVLPLRTADDLLMAFINMSTTQVQEPETDATGVTEVRLGEVLLGHATDGDVFELEIYAQEWRDLRPGRLRDTLRALSLLPLARQNTYAPPANSKGVGPVPHPSFHYDVRAGGIDYRCTPHFVGERCEFIAIRSLS